MGLLSLGTPLPWLESKNYNEHVRRHGIEQLLYVFQSAAKRVNDPLYWGDEVEYLMVQFNKADNTCQLDVSHHEVLDALNSQDKKICDEHDIHFHPEYGSFMLEATPAVPYHAYMGTYIEYNMAQRRKVAEWKHSQYNDKDISCKPLTLTVFPRMGCPNFTNLGPDSVVWNHKNYASRSLFLPDEVINSHMRFPTLTANIRSRRGEKVRIYVPMYRDVHTPKLDDTIGYKRNWFPQEDKEAQALLASGYMDYQIYMDSMGFGMGCSCLQVTFQAPNINMARYLYDSFINLAPIMLAASAAAPCFKGWLADQDVRWSVISDAVDDRTPAERDEEPLLSNENTTAAKLNGRIPKSRYSVVDLYLGGNEFFQRSLNDTQVPLNDCVLQRLLENEIYPMDYDLAKHFAHLYIRDPLVIFEESIDQDNRHSTNHFENIQSTNWQTVRFKPPTQEATPDNKQVPGWRVEFRPLEVQLTDFENAAYSTFIYLITDYLLHFGHKTINPYVSMSKVWENMERAHRRDAIFQTDFYWKSDFFNTNDFNAKELPIAEIFHNPQNGIFPVFINPVLVQRRFVQKDWKELKENKDHQRLYFYLKLVSDRTSGKIPTTARYIRDFIMRHPDYRQDSRISQKINYDLVAMCDRLTHLDNSRDELYSFFGKELANFLLETKGSYHKE